MRSAREYVGALVGCLLVAGGVSALTATTPGLGSPAWAQSVVAAPSDIPANCSVDVTAPLTAWLSSLSPGTTAALPAGACYLVQTAIVLNNWGGITLNGQGATLERTADSPPAMSYPHANPFLWLVNATNVTITNLTIQGNNPANCNGSYGCYTTTHPFDAGLRLEGPRNVTLSGLTINRTYGDGVQIQPSSLRSADGVTITSSTITQDGRQGISLSGGSGLTVSGVTIDHSARAGIDLEPNVSANVINGVTITDTHIVSWLLGIASGGGGPVNDVTINNVTIPYSGTPAIYDSGPSSQQRTGWTITNSNLGGRRGPQPGILISHTTNAVVSGVTMSTEWGPGVGLVGSTGAQIGCVTVTRTLAPQTPIISADAASSWSGQNNTLSATPPEACTASTAPPVSNPAAPPVTTHPGASSAFPSVVTGHSGRAPTTAGTAPGQVGSTVASASGSRSSAPSAATGTQSGGGGLGQPVGDVAPVAAVTSTLRSGFAPSTLIGVAALLAALALGRRLLRRW
ncbi:MAG: right-handed parallel beta-helix repeat-containing protein [Actinomycetes bacterium]